MKKVCCIFQYHKLDMEEYEKLAINRFFDVLSEYDCILVLPEKIDGNEFINLNLDEDIKNKYLNKHNEFTFEYFDNKYFVNNHSGSTLWLTYDFINKFENNYEYILNGQSDVFIFKDPIPDYINKNYDFIGGYEVPYYTYWPQILYNEDDHLHYTQIFMNGGFALRKISYMKEAINENLLWFKDKIYTNIDKYNIGEDDYYSQQLYNSQQNSIPTTIESLQFSLLNTTSEYYYPILNFEYPYGCHGFQKSDFLIWLVNKFISENNILYHI